jgi:hypothetical protein
MKLIINNLQYRLGVVFLLKLWLLTVLMILLKNQEFAHYVLKKSIKNESLLHVRFDLLKQKFKSV